MWKKVKCKNDRNVIDVQSWNGINVFICDAYHVVFFFFGRSGIFCAIKWKTASVLMRTSTLQRRFFGLPKRKKKNKILYFFDTIFFYLNGEKCGFENMLKFENWRFEQRKKKLERKLCLVKNRILHGRKKCFF